MSRKKVKETAGRPECNIDMEQVKKLCKLHCTGEEIAGFFEIDYDTLLSKIKAQGYNNFSEYFERFSSKGKISLRRKQYELAMEGNTRMLQLLGNNWLGQSEKQEIDMTTKGNIPPQFLIQVVNDKTTSE